MKNYQLLQEALDKASQKGAFTLQENGFVVQALIGLKGDLDELAEFRKKNADLEAALKDQLAKEEEALKNDLDVAQADLEKAIDAELGISSLAEAIEKDSK